MLIITGAHVIPLQAVPTQHLLELLQHVVGHVLVCPLPADHNPTSIVQDRQPPTPEHEGVVLVRPGHQAPVLGLGVQGGVCIVVVHHPGVGHGHVGNGHDHVCHAVVLLPPTVGHIVHPLPTLLPDEPLVLAGVPIIPTRVGVSPTVHPPQHPPVTLYVLHLGHALHSVLITANAGPVLWILLQALAVQHAPYQVCESFILIAIGHLTDVGTGGHLVPGVEVVQHAGVDTADGLDTLVVCKALRS